MWRKRLRLAIALFVVVFAAVVGVSLRRGRKADTQAVARPANLDPNAVLQTGGPGEVTLRKEGKVTFSIKFGNQKTYADGRSVFAGGVTVVLPDKGGRQIIVEAQEAEVTQPPGRQVGTGVFTGGVKLTTSDGIVITTSSASYNDEEQMTRIPGPLAFKKGRMTGTGVGATYDQNLRVLWLLDQAKIDVVPDQQGNGAIHVTSKAAGMARAAHFMKFTGGARLDGEGHVTEANEATAFLTEDDERVTRLELRGNSRMVGKPDTSGPRDMRADDIDLVYAQDGRTLQAAKLVENASVQLPAEKGKTGRRIAGKAIDIALAPDGATVTNLVANENVQVDLPPDGDVPARRIRSASLLATGPPSTTPGQGGIQSATFAGSVEYRENRAASGTLAEIDRTAKSDRLDVKTKPGFGDLERAVFHSNVHFTDGPQTTADAPTAVYSIAEDRLDLSPEPGDTGLGPRVYDGRISVDARNVQMGLGSQKMKADTNVRSVMTPEQAKPAAAPQPSGGRGSTGRPPARGGSQPAPPASPSQAPGKKDDSAVKVPSLLKQDEPVSVKSNRLDYDGASSLATYEGNATLWQDETTIKADKIVVEDKTGNLRATSNVVSSMVLTEPADKTSPDKAAGKPAAAKPAAPKPVAPKPVAPKPVGPKPAAEPTTTVADELVYEDAKHRAIYTGHAHMSGPSGDTTGDRIELFLAEEGGQLERAEVDGNVVSRQETRRAYGSHLRYMAKDELYTMTGSPAKIFEQTPTNCRITEGTTLTFDRSLNTTTASGNSTAGQRTRTEPACPAEGSF
jgi:lipopolysaccharide export system protein LptA